MFTKINGSFTHDEKANQISNVKIVVDTSSVFTNHEKRDSHLRSPDFLDTQQFPQMIFTADNIKITLIMINYVWLIRHQTKIAN